MSSWNGCVVPDEQLHTNGRRCWSSTSAVCQSAEVDRSVLSSEQLWSSVFCCCGPVDLESLPDSLRDPALSLNIFMRQLKTHFFAKYWRDVLSALEIFLRMHYINLHFTYLLALKSRYVWLGDVVVRASDLQSTGCRFEAGHATARQQPGSSCSHTCASVNKRCKLVPV